MRSVLERPADGGHGRKPVVGSFREAALDEDLQPPGNVGPERRRLLVEDGGHGGDRVRLGEGAAAGQHLVEDGAEGEHIGAEVGGCAGGLLRRHVAGGSEDDARLGRRRDRGIGSGRRRRFRESEIENLDARAEDDVRGLQIAMHDAALVRVRQRFRDLSSDAKRIFQLERASAIRSASVGPSTSSITSARSSTP